MNVNTMTVMSGFEIRNLEKSPLITADGIFLGDDKCKSVESLKSLHISSEFAVIYSSNRIMLEKVK